MKKEEFPITLKRFLNSSISDNLRELVISIIEYWHENFNELPMIANVKDHDYIYFYRDKDKYHYELQLNYDKTIETFWRDRSIQKYGGDDYSNYKEALDQLKRDIEDLKI